MKSGWGWFPWNDFVNSPTRTPDGAYVQMSNEMDLTATDELLNGSCSNWVQLGPIG